MALFQSYAKPGVYTDVVIQAAGVPLTGTGRIPVIIGEGVEFFTQTGVELHRGSSAVADEQSVNENISDQIAPAGSSTFNTTFFPVVLGDGTGTVATDPSVISVQQVDASGNVIPVTVQSLNGATGQFVTQQIITANTDLQVTYFFKRTDTKITNEDLSAQIPSFAVAYLHSGVLNNTSTSADATLSVTNPGELGNLVSVQFVQAAVTKGLADAQAVIGAGTDAITIEIRKAGSPGTLRTVHDLANLIAAGIPTLDGGFLTLTTTANASTLVAGAAITLTGGSGPGTNTVFKVKNTPIVNGSNGGIVTNSVGAVTVLVNGNAASVAAVDGQHGLVTLSNPVAFGSTLTATYFTNTWQNTYDLLPSPNVGSVIQVGLGPSRSDFTQGTDFSLGTVQDAKGNVIASTINWGNNVSEAIGVSAALDSAPFTPAEVLETLVDEKVFLRPLTGAVNGKNTVFTLPDSPTDGGGRVLSTDTGRLTDDTTLLQVFVGSDPLEAFLNGAVPVARLSGPAQTVTLFNPPQVSVANQQNQKVYATYYRNTLVNNQYTVSVATPGFSGNGTYTIADQHGNVLPLVTQGVNTVADGGFATTGIVFPFGFQDAAAPAGAVDETVTLTFRSDGISPVTPAVQASVVFTFALNQTLTITASTPGLIGNNVKVSIDTVTLNPIPVVVNGDNVTIYANWDGSVHTDADIAGYFPSAATTSGGRLTAAVFGAAITATPQSATALTTGADAITVPVTHSYTVSSSAGATGSAGIGYLDQTYVDAKTGLRFTIVNPADHAAYGVPSIATSYAFAPADTLQFVVAKGSPRHTGVPAVAPCEANNQVAIPGLKSKVTSTFGSTAADTVIVTTERLSSNNPAVGEFYYADFTVNKTASDFALKLYTNPVDAYAQYGQPTTANRLSLAISLMSQNGVQTFGVIQVKKQPGQNLATDADFITAIQSLAIKLPGTTRKADVIVPLSTSVAVHQFLGRFLTTAANLRNKGEALGFVGYSQFTDSNTASANARGLKNARMIAIGSPVAGVQITNPSTGAAQEFAVSGEFMAAAMAGLNCNPANDVATTLTLQNLVGFTRLLIKYDDPTMDLMAASGLVLLEDNNGALQIRHYKSTDPSNPITSEPTSTTSVDYTRQQFRSDLQQFVGRKLVDALVTDITATSAARLKSLTDNQILTGYKNLVVQQDATDPTVVDVTVSIRPMFSALYIGVVFTVSVTL